jgi:hypothetical protein
MSSATMPGTLKRAAAAWPPTCRAYLALAERAGAAQAPLPIVFGHNDLLPGNFLDDGRGSG